MGGGQLAQMLALAAYPLGIKTICYETHENCPAALVTEVIVGAYTDQRQLAEFAARVDVITYEFENIPVNTLEYIVQATHKSVYPLISALTVAQDRLNEKSFFDKVQVPTTRYMAVNSLAELEKAMGYVGLPAVLKTRRLGYDGKGQYVIRQQQDIQAAWQPCGDQPLLVEDLVSFDRELSCLAVRNAADEVVFYPVTTNQHREGILRVSKVENIDPDIQQLAQEYTGRVLSDLNYVGVLAIEFFQRGNQLIANEMAPRVHNSGHWTIEGAQTSQFENHIRAVAGLPLGATQAKGHVGMVNLIGHVPELATILSIPEAHCHIYSKQPRPGRKLGHVTLCMNDDLLYQEKLQQLVELISK